MYKVLERETFILFNMYLLMGAMLFSNSCSPKQIQSFNYSKVDSESDITIAFGSCYNQEKKCPLWDAILYQEPDIWIWGGDNVYSDTDDSIKLWRDYAQLINDSNYIKLRSNADILATWDDHDYGLNDGGREFHAKEMSKRQFLKFVGADEDDQRYYRDGIYMTKSYKVGDKQLDIVLLDTRYFRSPLTPSRKIGRRYEGNAYGKGTLLGEEQWMWLEKKFGESQADYTIIVSSIQFLSSEHGYEKWANFPHEVDRLLELIKKYKKPGVVILSGDRHISEFSLLQDDNIGYPLMDFTSSGLTHTYESFSGEQNPYRHGEVYNVKSFGLLKVDAKNGNINFYMIDENNTILSSHRVSYK